MSLIEQAGKRLAELRRTGIPTPLAKKDDPVNLAASSRPSAQQDSTNGSWDPGASPVPGSSAPRRVDLDLARLASAGIVTPDAPRSQIADEFRVLKRPLIANAFGGGASPIEHGNLIMVTSSVPAEGKTFTAINLAMSMAMELDRTVLLVDADVARPSIPRILGLESARGFLDVLLDKSVDLGQVLLRTNINKLTILCAGTQHHQSTELLASAAMEGLLSELASRYADRIIVFDSPPLLVTTEARVLATQMGQIVYVVQAEDTLRSEVHQGLMAIENCPVKLLVLNQARSIAQGAYGYGYNYYGYRHRQ